MKSIASHERITIPKTTVDILISILLSLATRLTKMSQLFFYKTRDVHKQNGSIAQSKLSDKERKGSSLTTSSRASTVSRRTNRSLDTLLSLRYKEANRTKHITRTQTASSLPVINSPDSLLPSIDGRTTAITSKSSELNCRRDSRTSHSSNESHTEKQQEKIRQWFATATEKEKNVALNLLSAVSPNLCPKNIKPKLCSRCGNNDNTKQKKQHLTPLVKTVTSEDKTRINTSFVDHVIPLNQGALSYYTPWNLPHEFVIHPEWNEPYRKPQPQLEKLDEKAAIEPCYGYWRK
ncbi:uncharacterized protein LOC130613315 isoform X2 [Hydractinia symbiolongicarpus]|uniref:uncharacterized protein LOC130613315 isoform X2 n=1 Tax=Hydractinia symbiolongicarpus TaxID=13093 RepID=UPI00254C4A92|nr:uncharacterized protein LOC130613315 isoform X2 [Hydractinia symbiolongicarpus]